MGRRCAREIRCARPVHGLRAALEEFKCSDKQRESAPWTPQRRAARQRRAGVGSARSDSGFTGLASSWALSGTLALRQQLLVTFARINCARCRPARREQAKEGLVSGSHRPGTSYSKGSMTSCPVVACLDHPFPISHFPPFLRVLSCPDHGFLAGSALRRLLSLPPDSPAQPCLHIH